MTLKELFAKVEFDNVAPFIVRHYPELAHCMAGFKMAFDGMRNTAPADVCEETITVELCADEDEKPYLTAYHSDNDVWENVVGREVVIAADVTASLEEIVAVILFDATYWGFTPANREETFSEWDKDTTPPTSGNPYRIKWWHLTQREHDSECRKEDIGKRTYTLASSLSEELKWMKQKKRRNRSKRKRAYRWKKRIDELDRLANRWDLLQQIKHSVPNADLSFFESRLFDKSVHCEVSEREDYSADGIGLSYIHELMTKYDQRYSKEADITLLWVQSPHDIDMNVMEKIRTFVSDPIIAQDINPLKHARTRLTIVQLFNNPK